MKAQMKSKRAGSVFLLIVLVCALTLSSVSSGEGVRRIPEFMKDVDAVDLQGNAADPKALFGSAPITMVNIWATYCGPCLQEMQALGELSREWKEQDIRVIGLVTDVINNSFEPDSQKVALAQQIAEQTGADYPHLILNADLYRNVTEVINGTLQYVPTTIFIDSRGRLIGQVYVGARDKAGWEAVLSEVLAEVGRSE